MPAASSPSGVASPVDASSDHDVEHLEDGRVGDDVDGDDAAARDDQLERAAEPAVRAEHGPGGAVDEREAGGPRPAEQGAGHRLRAREPPDAAELRDVAVRPQDDVRVEDGDEPGQVAVARRAQERPHDAGWRPASAVVAAPGGAPCTRRRARLAS